MKINIKLSFERIYKKLPNADINVNGERCMSDIKRDMQLNMMGWIVKRFWVYQLKYDLDNCILEIKKLAGA